MSETTALSELDVIATMKILSEVAASSGDATARKRMLMDGMAGLVNARYWYWVMTEVDEATRLPAPTVSSNFEKTQSSAN